MTSQQNLKPLKILVISMGVVLIGGTIFVVSLVAQKFSHPVAGCPGGNVDLKGHGVITESRIDDQTLRLTLEKTPGTDEIVTLDLCSGKQLGSLTVHADPGMLEE